jgi:DNA-binding LytR/AlgR family response regulator
MADSMVPLKIIKYMKATKQVKKASRIKADFEKVVYLSSDINYTALHFANGQKEIFAYTLKIFEDFLKTDGHFIRIHRHFLVNKKFIEMKNRTDIKLVTGINLPIARRRRIVL